LVRDDGFNPNQVDGFLSDFKKTIEFAALKFDSEEEDDVSEQDFVDRVVSKVSAGAGTSQDQLKQHKPSLVSTSFPIPLRKQKQAVIAFSALPLDKADLELLKKWIDLMADNLTEGTFDLS
jgi:hypothetical protein